MEELWREMVGKRRMKIFHRGVGLLSSIPSHLFSIQWSFVQNEHDNFRVKRKFWKKKASFI